MPCLQSPAAHRLTVNCHVGKDVGRAKDVPERNWSNSGACLDTLKPLFAVMRDAGSMLIREASYLARCCTNAKLLKFACIR